MKRIKEELDNLYLEIEHAKNLALLLEDYFYETLGDSRFNKNASLANSVVGRIQQIDKKTSEIYQLISQECKGRIC